MKDSKVTGAKKSIKSKAPTKPIYSPPKLTIYGHITKLTAAGSAGAPEGASSSKQKQRP